MSPAAELLAKLRRRGIALRVVGDRLRFRPASEMSAELLAAVAEHKPALLALLPKNDWRDALELAERDRLPPGWEPDAATVAALLTARELFDAELVAVRLPPTVDDLPADLRELYEERAAIREHDGGEPRDVAEREAMAEIRRLAEPAALWSPHEPA